MVNVNEFVNSPTFHLTVIPAQAGHAVKRQGDSVIMACYGLPPSGE